MLDLLELELEVAVNCLVRVLGTELRSSRKAIKTLLATPLLQHPSLPFV